MAPTSPQPNPETHPDTAAFAAPEPTTAGAAQAPTTAPSWKKYVPIAAIAVLVAAVGGAAFALTSSVTAPKVDSTMATISLAVSPSEETSTSAEETTSSEQSTSKQAGDPGNKERLVAPQPNGPQPGPAERVPAQPGAGQPAPMPPLNLQIDDDDDWDDVWDDWDDDDWDDDDWDDDWDDDDWDDD